MAPTSYKSEQMLAHSEALIQAMNEYDMHLHNLLEKIEEQAQHLHNQVGAFQEPALQQILQNLTNGPLKIAVGSVALLTSPKDLCHLTVSESQSDGEACVNHVEMLEEVVSKKRALGADGEETASAVQDINDTIQLLNFHDASENTVTKSTMPNPSLTATPLATWWPNIASAQWPLAVAKQTALLAKATEA